MTKKKAAAPKRSVAKKRRARAMATPAAPRKQAAKAAGPPDYSKLAAAIAMTEENHVAVIDCGFGDVFQLVEHGERYAINRAVKWETAADGSLMITEYRLLTADIARLSEALRVMAAEIDRVDQDPKRKAA